MKLTLTSVLTLLLLGSNLIPVSSVLAQATTTLTAEQQTHVDALRQAAEDKKTSDSEGVTSRQEADSTVGLQQCISNYGGSMSQWSQQSSQHTIVLDITLISLTQNMSQQLDKQLGQSKEIAEKICTHLYSIRRIQKAFERKTFVDDPYNSRKSVIDIEEYKMKLMNFVKSGYADNADGSETRALYPENLGGHLKRVVAESFIVFQDSLQKVIDNNSNNSFALEAVKEELERREVVDTGTLENRLTSDLSEDELSELRGGSNQISDPIKFAENFIKYSDPSRPNNVYSQFMIANNVRRIQQAEARELALQELLQGEGFLPVTECPSGLTTADGTKCRYRTTVTPGSVIANNIKKALETRVDYILQGVKERIAGSEPTVSETQNFEAAGTTGIGRPINSNPHEDNDYTDPDDDIDGDSIPNWKDDDFTQGSAPLVAITATSSDDGTQMILAWTSTNADTCWAENAWITQKSGDDYVIDSLANKNRTLNTTGAGIIDLPLYFDVLAYLSDISGTVGSNLGTVSHTLRDGIKQTTTLTIPNVSSATYWVFGFNETNTGPRPIAANTTGADIISNLYDLILNFNNNNNPTTLRYEWSKNGDVMTISTLAKYKIACSNDYGITKAEVTLTP